MCVIPGNEKLFFPVIFMTADFFADISSALVDLYNPMAEFFEGGVLGHKALRTDVKEAIGVTRLVIDRDADYFEVGMGFH